MAIGDIIQIRMFQQLGSFFDPQVNVFYYQQTSGVNDFNATDAVGEFLDNVWDVVRELQVSAQVTTRYTAINLMNTSDFIEFFPNSAGNHAAAGFPFPAFICAGFRAPREAAGQRYSYKRITGAQSGNLGSGGAWNSSYQSLLNAAALAMGTQLEGAAGTYVPVQVRSGWKLGSTIPEEMPKVNYELLGAWSFNQYPTHQDTRQDAYYDWVAAAPP